MKKRCMALTAVAAALSAALFGCGAISDFGAGSGIENTPRDELFASSQEASDSPAWVRLIPQAQDPDVSQLFVVAGLGMDKTTAIITMHERDEDGAWKQVMTTPGYVGKYGLCPDEDHAEGCAQTPLGTYGFNRAFGIAKDPGCALDYVQVDDNIYWSGDQRDGMRYNELVDIEDYPDLDLENSEHIIDYSYEYRYCLNISFNDDGTPGRGSAIFLHCQGIIKPYTGGCVAVPEYLMKQIMQRVKPDCVVVIDTLKNLTGGEYVGEEFSVDYGSSEFYNGQDMDSAVSMILTEFNSWEGCKLNTIRYAGDENSTEENLVWLNELAAANPEKFSGNYTQSICFLTDFHSPTEEIGAWEPDREYADYQWWLARSEGGSWELLTWGY